MYISFNMIVSLIYHIDLVVTRPFFNKTTQTPYLLLTVQSPSLQPLVHPGDAEVESSHHSLSKIMPFQVINILSKMNVHNL